MTTVRRPLRFSACIILLAAALAAIGALPAAAKAVVPSQFGGTFANIAVSRVVVLVFTDAGTRTPGSVIELSPVTGRRIRTLRERKPGQVPWVVAAYQKHPWTTVLLAGDVPALTEISAAGAFTHSVKLAYDNTPDGPFAGAAALAGSHLWAATGSSDGAPTGLLEVSAVNGARTRFLRWPRALRQFSPEGMTVSGNQIWMTDGECEVARVTITSDRGAIFLLPPRDCQIGTDPAKITAADGHVWVQAYNSDNGNQGSVAELNSRDGHLIRLIPGQKYGWDCYSFAAAGRDLWVTSQMGGFGGNGTVTELSVSTGRLVHLFSARRYHFDQPMAIAALGGHAWVLNLRSVTKL